MLRLLEKQWIFSILAAKLILKANEMGYKVTFGEAYRSPQEAARLDALGKGIAKSLHTKRLAIDLNLFKDGKYLQSTDDHRELGEWWEQQSLPGITCSWGGRFDDGNHYSIEHNGVK